MLSTKYSLSGKENFERVEKDGRMFQSESFGLSVLAKGDESISRFGFIVSNRISGDAVQRNRIKRALKAAVKYSLTEIPNGYDVVFLAKPSSLRKNTDILILEAKQALREVNLLKI